MVTVTSAWSATEDKTTIPAIAKYFTVLLNARSPVDSMAVVPWWSLDTHVHLDHVQWVPFVTPPQKVSDVVANVLMYVPFGYIANDLV